MPSTSSRHQSSAASSTTLADKEFVEDFAGRCLLRFAEGYGSHGSLPADGFRMKAIEPNLPNKRRGFAGVDDRRVLNGIFCCVRA